MCKKIDLRYKVDLKSKYLANILYAIGYEFYKGINGAYLQFEVEENTQKDNLFGETRNYTIYAIDEEDNKCEFFQLDQNNRICEIQPKLLDYFEFHVEQEIIIDKWEHYLVGGIKEEKESE